MPSDRLPTPGETQAARVSAIEGLFQDLVRVARSSIEENPWLGVVRVQIDRQTRKILENSLSPATKALQNRFAEAGWELKWGWEGQRETGHSILEITPPQPPKET
jgi:hypothetical protein